MQPRQAWGQKKQLYGCDRGWGFYQSRTLYRGDQVGNPFNLKVLKHRGQQKSENGKFFSNCRKGNGWYLKTNYIAVIRGRAWTKAAPRIGGIRFGTFLTWRPCFKLPDHRQKKAPSSWKGSQSDPSDTRWGFGSGTTPDNCYIVGF